MELFGARNPSHDHISKDPNRLRLVSPGMRANTRYINSAKGTFSKNDVPQWHIYIYMEEIHIYIYVSPPFQTHSATQQLDALRPVSQYGYMPFRATATHNTEQLLYKAGQSPLISKLVQHINTHIYTHLYVNACQVRVTVRDSSLLLLCSCDVF